MKIEYKAISMETNKEELSVTLGVTSGYSTMNEIEVPLCQIDMVIDLLKHAKEDLSEGSRRAAYSMKTNGELRQDAIMEGATHI